MLEISKEQLILTGIETYICVLQTALSALSLGFEVYLVYDATSSAFEEDNVVAVQRLAKERIKSRHIRVHSIRYAEKLGTSLVQGNNGNG
ncbi:MAG: isochorismatase family protein [Candidatus Korarchaeota archaeon]|nr:isochorismatase family protein [Candidatus Korarchaeota archaeon]